MCSLTTGERKVTGTVELRGTVAVPLSRGRARLGLAYLPRRPTLSTRAFVPLLGAALPAVGLRLLALLGGLSSADLDGALIGALLVLAAPVVIWCAARRRHDPVGATLGATVFGIAAPAVVYLLPSLLPNQGAWEGVDMAAFFAAAAIAPIACLALVGRGHAASRAA